MSRIWNTGIAQKCTGKTKEQLQKEGILRSGGNATNGLFCVRGASRFISDGVARENGIAVSVLREKIPTFAKVKNADKKTSDHLENIIKYSTIQRLEAFNLIEPLKNDGFIKNRKLLIPVLCKNEKPIEEITEKIYKQMLGSDILISPLQAAVDAYHLRKEEHAPEWIRTWLLF